MDHLSWNLCRPSLELDVSVLMRATYMGEHEAFKMGKQHPQAPPLHIHFAHHTISTNYVQGSSPSSNIPVQDGDGATNIAAWVPHQLWPVAPDYPFWSTTEGIAYEASLPDAGTSDSTLLLWGHPKTNTAFFLAILALTDAMMLKRVAITSAVAANMFASQTASDMALLIAPNAWWLGPLRWVVLWYAQRAMKVLRRALGGRDVVKLVEDII
ncbi:hypothetical protein BDW69DRAFT_197871 [Aspergillus filifer]